MEGVGGTERRIAGRYRLDGLIGRGGAGAVWRGQDEQLDRPVAIKQIVFPSDAAEAEVGHVRALREARAAARLRDAGVVQIYDILEEDGSAYLIMELVDAPNLSGLVRRNGPLTPRAAARMGVHVLDTLAAAHRSGIIHRDVKPSNVLVDGDTPRLTDFGIARLGDESTLTTTGVVMGTPAYIAPEHARGQDVGPPADLYGLGATLYYAVEGTAPFGEGGALPTVMAVMHKPPRVMRRAGPLTRLLEDLLAKDPEDRPRAEEVRARLRAARVAPQVVKGPAPPAGAEVAEDTGAFRAVVAADPVAGPDAPVPGRAHPATVAAEQRTGPTPLPRAVVGAGGTSARSGRRPALLAVALVAALSIVLGLAWRDDDGGPGDGQGDASRGGAAGAAAGGTTGGPTGGTGDAANDVAAARPPRRPSPAAGGRGHGVLPAHDVDVPADWVVYAPDGGPYRVAHPPGWQVVDRAGNLTDIRDPRTGMYLRLDWVAARRDPVEAWEELSASFDRSRDGYRRLGIRPTRFKGDRAALWEYRYREGGAALHAYNLGVNAGDHGYALNLQARQRDFDEARRLWPYFLASYRFLRS